MKRKVRKCVRDNIQLELNETELLLAKIRTMAAWHMFVPEDTVHRICSL